MKTLLSAIAVALFSFSAQAKDLSVMCENANYKVALEGALANANAPLQLKSFVVNGTSLQQVKDTSSAPVYKDGLISIRLAFGKMLYNSLELKVSKCDDDFEATGSAILKNYVGGFAGTEQSKLNCRCALK